MLASPLAPASHFDTGVEPERVRRFTFDEYWKMHEDGFFDSQRVELLLGEVVEMSPQGENHFVAINLTRRALEQAFGVGWLIRTQATLKLSTGNAPDPDLSVVEGDEADALRRGTPTGAVLVVEVSQTTLRFDRATKAEIYAASGIEDYWIVNLAERQLEVRRRPMPEPASRTGFRYTDVNF